MNITKTKIQTNEDLSKELEKTKDTIQTIIQGIADSEKIEQQIQTLEKDILRVTPLKKELTELKEILIGKTGDLLYAIITVNINILYLDTPEFALCKKELIGLEKRVTSTFKPRILEHIAQTEQSILSRKNLFKNNNDIAILT